MLRATTLAILATLAAAAPAGAATFTVSSTRDATDAAIDGTCAATGGGCTLRAALEEANATTASDDIVLPAGRFRITLAGTNEDAAATGDFDSTHDLTITGVGADRTIIDGNGADRVLQEVGGDLTVRSVTVTGGLAPDNGIGILGGDGALTVLDSAIVANTALPGSDGGGIAAYGSSTLVERSLIAGNHAYNGGGIDDGAGPITVRSSTIAYNTAGDNADNGDGGAIDGNATILDSAIVGNIAWNGAGSPGGIGGGTLRNTVLAGNLSFDTGNPTDPGIPDNCGGTFTSQGNNVSDDASCALSGSGDRNELDPQLSDLSDHGGPFDSIVLLPGSPLIDTGAGCDVLDMRGDGRPSGGACDVGPTETALPAIGGSAVSAIGQTAAAVTGAVDPAHSPATVHVEYGTTSAYGSSTPDAPAGGALAVTLTGLAPGTAYHARIVATNGYGTTPGPDVTFTTQAIPRSPDTTPARVSNLKVPKKARGRLTFSLNERATVTLAFIGANGHRKATLKVIGVVGKNAVRLPRKLKAGRYALVISARDLAGNRTAPAIRTIRLRKA
jgi:hypothetical protein